jgi:hypothetical protein
MTNLPRLAVIPAIFTFLSSPSLFAQTPTAVVNGTVVDPSGAAVPDARVTVVNHETNVASTKNTTGGGTFNLDYAHDQLYGR